VTLNRSVFVRAVLLVSLMANLTILSNNIKADTGSCGGAMTTLPFTDVQGNLFFCQIAAAYFSGLTAGTSATTFSPAQNVSREQMAAFTTRTLDQSLKRGNQRAALGQWWTPKDETALALTTVGDAPNSIQSDGADLWVANYASHTISRVRASDGKLLETWTGADSAIGILIARGKVFMVGYLNPGRLYRIDPTQPAGNVDTITSSLGDFPRTLTFDGKYIWTANVGAGGIPGTISKVNPDTGAVQTFSTGFAAPFGILYDGSHVWVTDEGDNTIKKVDENGAILSTINVGIFPEKPIFDGVNIWVPNPTSNSVTLIRVKDAQGSPLPQPFILATLTDNGLTNPNSAAFDGQRVLITNLNGSASLWKATDLSPQGSVFIGALKSPVASCSDGVNFWVVCNQSDQIARF
jgi:hypothetical protein